MKKLKIINCKGDDEIALQIVNAETILWECVHLNKIPQEIFRTTVCVMLGRLAAIRKVDMKQFLKCVTMQIELAAENTDCDHISS
jgi:hypothetical protein